MCCLVGLSGGEITSTFDCPEKTKLGHCSLIEEVMIGEDKLLKFSGNMAHLFRCFVLLRVMVGEDKFSGNMAHLFSCFVLLRVMVGEDKLLKFSGNMAHLFRCFVLLLWVMVGEDKLLKFSGNVG